MITIDFTFQTVTEESAEHGDFDSSGFIMPGMWRYEEDYKRQEWKLGDLRNLIDFALALGICSDGDNLYSVDPDIDYRTGKHTTYGMHIAGVTAATEARIHKLLTY